MSNVKLQDYAGMTIEVDQRGRFQVPELNHGDHYRGYESLEKAQAAVDRRNDTRKRVAKEKISLPVFYVFQDRYTRGGGYNVFPGVWTGLHATQASMLGKVTDTAGKYGNYPVKDATGMFATKEYAEEFVAAGKALAAAQARMSEAKRANLEPDLPGYRRDPEAILKAQDAIKADLKG